MAHILPGDDEEAPDPGPVPSGWECPRCLRVWNPSVQSCQDCPQHPAFIAKGDAG